MASPARRESDDEEKDYRSVRGGGGPFNGHTKWVIGVIGAGIVALASWGVSNDRAQVERRLTAVESLSMNLALSQSKATQQLEEIQRTLGEIKADVREVKGRR